MFETGSLDRFLRRNFSKHPRFFGGWETHRMHAYT